MPESCIVRTLELLHGHVGAVFEICGIGTDRSPKAVDGGFFDDRLKAVEAARKLTKDHHAVYVTLNPVDPALLARAENRIKSGLARTKDAEILRLHALLVDADPKRPAGISSTVGEHQAALDLCQVVKAELSQAGWPDPLVGDSGNGGHLLYCLPDLENTPANVGLVKTCLQALAHRYDTPQVAIDQSVFNPARISKLYGTWARKGDSTEDRPHRKSKVLALPDRWEPVEVTQLRALAELAPEQESKPKLGTGQNTVNTYIGPSFDLARYLERYNVDVRCVKEHKGATLYILDECLFNASHSGGEAAIVQSAKGTLYYQCFHNGCTGKTWHDARRVISGEASLRDFMPESVSKGSNGSNGSKGSEWKQGEAGRKQDGSKEEASGSNAPDSELQSFTAQVREWVTDSIGCFTTTDLDREFNLTTRAEKNRRAKALNILVYKEKNIIKDRVIRGKYHVLDSSLSFITPNDHQQEDSGLLLPIGLNDLVSIPPKALVIVAGTTNSGKTALLLSIAAKNLDQSPGRIMYLMSEMGGGEFKRRLRRFEDIPYEKWFTAMRSAERSTGFLSAIRGANPNGITLVDFLEEDGGEFYKMGSKVREIYDALDTGVAVVAMQKGSASTYARGGEATAEKARLYLTLDRLVELDHGVITACKIIKAKDYSGPNPNGKEIHLKITGAGITPLTEWQRLTPKDREAAQARYEAGFQARGRR